MWRLDVENSLPHSLHFMVSTLAISLSTLSLHRLQYLCRPPCSRCTKLRLHSLHTVGPGIAARAWCRAIILPAAAFVRARRHRRRRRGMRERASGGWVAWPRVLPVVLLQPQPLLPVLLPAAGRACPRARDLEGVLFGVGQVLAHVLAVQAALVRGAAFVGAVHPARARLAIGRKLFAARAALDGAAARGGGGLLAVAPRGVAYARIAGVTARIRAVPDGALGRRDRLAALLALCADHPGDLPLGLGRAPLAVGGAGACVVPKAAAAQPACGTLWQRGAHSLARL